MISHYRFIFYVIFIFWTVECVEIPTRDINFEVNPGCVDQNCDEPWLISGEGRNANNTMHYLWSAVKVPSFILAISDANGSNVLINWDDLQLGVQGSITFDPLPQNVFGIQFQSLILFNDETDHGTLDGITEENKIYLDLSSFEWSFDQPNEENSTSSSFSNVFRFNAVNYNDSLMGNYSSFSFSVSVPGLNGRSDNIPHLITTPNSVQLEVTLDNLTYPFQEEMKKRDFRYPRWALDAIIVSTDSSKFYNNQGFLFEDKTSLDDEHTPGVFNIHSITTDSARNETSGTGSSGAYMQWRPVCYLTPSRDINFSTMPNTNTTLPPVDKEHFEAAKGSLFFALFGEQFVNKLNAQVTFAFGFPKDGFYTKYNYTVWTVSMGLGALPVERFSIYAIILICIGAGVPLIMFLVGGVYLLIKKRRSHGELLLGGN